MLLGPLGDQPIPADDPDGSTRVRLPIDARHNRLGAVVERDLDGLAVLVEMLARRHARVDEALLVVGLPERDLERERGTMEGRRLQLLRFGRRCVRFLLGFLALGFSVTGFPL